MQKTSIPRIVVSGLKGGSGKTLISLSLISSFRKKGIKTISFKKGPDYIDAGWMAKASGHACYNLDLFMMTPEQSVKSFISHSTGFQLAVIEGNRGLFDGLDSEGTYSTAELAKLLKAPVILIVDCTKVTTTLAAMVLGCRVMDPDLSIGGIILNRVATSRQEAVIRKAIYEKTSLPVLGAVPRLKNDPFPERHMGLTPFQEHQNIEESISSVAGIGEKYLDLDALSGIANDAYLLNFSSKFKNPPIPPLPKAGKRGLLNIGIIRDSAFQFYYQDNIDALVQKGAGIIEVSPLTEKVLRDDIDALYIGGGFPETHAIALADNTGFRSSLNSKIQAGLPVYAECGGLMYLGESITMQDKTYPMVGVLPVSFSLGERPQAHGYTIVEVERENPYFKVGTVLKGHEFHYSRVLEASTPLPPANRTGRPLDRGESDQTYMAFNMRRGKGIVDNKDGLCYKNVFATYTHLHAAGAPEWADGLVKCAAEYRNIKEVRSKK